MGRRRMISKDDESEGDGSEASYMVDSVDSSESEV